VGGQHHGVYGFPFCMADQSIFCDLFRHFLSIGVYLLFIQEILVQAEYWHDPFYEESYKLDCIFLPDINQEVKFNPLYKERLSNVSNFVLIKFEQDRMVQPIETQWFGFYKPGQAVETYSLFDSRLYKQDLLGLKYLNDTGRLHLLSSPNGHTLLTYKWLKLFVIPFINVTYNDSHKPITLKTDPYLTYRKLITNPSAPSCITYNSQNISIYGQNDGSIYQYDQEGNLINHHINVLPEHIRATSISAYNTTLYMAGNDNRLYLYSTITNHINRTQYFSYNSINGISIHGGLIYISKYRSIDVLDNNGGRLTTSLSLGSDSNPSKVQIDSNGNIRVIDCDTGIIHVLSKGGKDLLREYSTISMYPVALAVDDDDNMIVCDGDGYVYVYDSNGQLIRKIDGFHTCTDVLYIDGTLWITDVIDSKIYLF
jgi:palmitoyl-protein thioesterase